MYKWKFLHESIVPETPNFRCKTYWQLYAGKFGIICH